MSRFAQRSLTILGLSSALFCAVMIGSAVYPRRQAKTLIEDLRRLDTVTDPAALFGSLKQKHRDQLTEEKCISDDCHYEFLISNRILSTFHLAPRTELHALINLYHGSLATVGVQYTSGTFKENSPIVYVQEDFCADRTDITCDHFDLNPHGRDVTPTWNGIVEFGQLAIAEQKRAAWALNLDCVTAFQGCKDISQLLPTVWKLTSPRTVSSRMRSTADSIVEASQPLPE
jgi:hypothetical protein